MKQYCVRAKSVKMILTVKEYISKHLHATCDGHVYF